MKQEFHDLDYLNKLSPQEKEWLGQFMNEYLGANTVGSKFHKTKKDKKLVRDANNARNRDVYANKRAGGLITDYEKFRTSIDEVSGSSHYEEELVDYIDSKKVIKN